MKVEYLDILTTALGIVSGIATVLASNGIYPDKTGIVAGATLALLGYFSNQKPKA